MAKKDITVQTRRIDAYLATLENPLHRKIIENYRRHAILEITSNKDDIFAPEMAVEHPVYDVYVGGACITLEGREAVLGLYGGVQDVGSSVIVVEDEKLAVADWGFASEAMYFQYYLGSQAPAGLPAEPDKFYIQRRRLAGIWPYDERGRMIGEHLYDFPADDDWYEISSEDFITLDEAREKLYPLLNTVTALDLSSSS